MMAYGNITNSDSTDILAHVLNIVNKLHNDGIIFLLDLTGHCQKWHYFMNKGQKLMKA